MTREFFDNNVIIAVEVEYKDGGRYWTQMHDSEVKEFCDRVREAGDFISDIDYCTKQESTEVREFLDSCYEEWFKGDHKFKSLDELINSKFETPKKVWTEEEIKNLVQTNDKVLYGALKKLYAQQTADEKYIGGTKEKNGRGFNSLDAKFLTSVSEFLIKNGFLTYKQKLAVRKKLVKYNKQLTRLANA